jgi:DNA-binding transcriptional MerR regulator
MIDKTTGLVGLGEAAQLVGVKPWKITYAMTAGYVEEPPRVANKRAFDAEAIERLKMFFGSEETADE